MSTALLEAVSTTLPWEEFLAAHGRVVAVFDHRTQDSGNVSYGVDTGAGRFFVKTAGRPGPPPPGAPVPYLDHAARVALLRNAIELARSLQHPTLPRLRHVVESGAGPALVHDWAPGELVGVPRERRGDPASAYRRLAAAPAPMLLGVLDQLLGLQAELARAGWVAQDLYDGCLLVDLSTGRLSVVDLDTYTRGPTTNTMGRMFGSDRFMAPEEHRLGARIDQRTTVFTLGRLAWHFGTRLSEQREHFVGPAALAVVVERACSPEPSERHGSVAELWRCWQQAR